MKYWVSIQPQIWDNDAIWVWWSLASLPLPQTHHTTTICRDTSQHWDKSNSARDLSLGGATSLGHLILLLCLLSSSAQKTVNEDAYFFSHFLLFIVSFLFRLLFLLLVGCCGWLPGWHRPNTIVCPQPPPPPPPPPTPPPPLPHFPRTPHFPHSLLRFLLPFILLNLLGRFFKDITLLHCCPNTLG